MNCLCAGARFMLCSQTPSSSKRLVHIHKTTESLRRGISTILKKRFEVPNEIKRVDRRTAAYLLRHTTFKDLMQMYHITKPFKWWLVCGTSFLIVSSGVFLVIPRVLGKLIDDFDEGSSKVNDAEHLTITVARFFKQHPYALVGLLFIGAVAATAKVYCMQVAGTLIAGNLRKSVFNSVLRQDMKFFDRNMVGEIGSRHAADVLIVGYTVSSNLNNGVRAILVGIGSVVAMIHTSLELSSIALLTAPIVFGVFKIFGRVQQYSTFQLQEAAADVNQLASERMMNIKTVRMLSAEQSTMDAYSKLGTSILEITKTEALAKGALIGSFQFTGYSAFSTILFYGSHLISEGHMTYGELSSFCLYAILSATSLSNITGFFNDLMKGLGAASRLLELKNSQPTIPITGGIRKNDVEDKISFENVSFSYAGRGFALRNVSFDIPRGKITAVVGPSGSGKSSVAGLMLRMYDPSEGKITVDGLNLRSLDPSHWRHGIGTVGQEPVLFSCSIKDNILMGAEYPDRVTQDELEEAAAQANALEFIQSFRNGFNTLVGEDGRKLSGGQKQRIAIARALIGKPKILILDEATSALDATSDYLIRMALQNLLAKHNVTALVIAHRLATIQSSDQVIVLNRGTVAGSGKYEDMLLVQNEIVREEAERRGMPIHEQMTQVRV